MGVAKTWLGVWGLRARVYSQDGTRGAFTSMAWLMGNLLAIATLRGRIQVRALGLGLGLATWFTGPRGLGICPCALECT